MPVLLHEMWHTDGINSQLLVRKAEIKRSTMKKRRLTLETGSVRIRSLPDWQICCRWCVSILYRSRSSNVCHSKHNTKLQNFRSSS